MHDHSAASFFGPLLVPILGVHLLERKVAVLVLKPTVVQRKQLAEDLAFHLLYEIWEGVAIDEATLLGIMGMQIKVEGESVL